MSSLKRFPQMEGRKLLLASPGDVAYLRVMAQQVVDDLDGEDGRVSDLTMFAWETDMANTPFSDNRPIQEQIYRPDDPNCMGVIAFFGEKIGQPLADDFPVDMLEEISRA